MSKSHLYVGQTPVKDINPAGGTGEFTHLDGEVFYKIKGFENMAPFLMTVVSPNNHWMFLASNGALTAGRKNPEWSLFPYYTDDKILDSAEITGSKTILRVQQASQILLWEPFSGFYPGAYSITRNLYKNRVGNKVIFEEVNHDLSLRFQYQWTFSDAYGFVKKATLENLGATTCNLELLDGLQNILPAGVNSQLQETRSTLVDAYKKNELDPENGLGIFSLSSMIVDKAEPSEALSATTVFTTGLSPKLHLLSSRQLQGFRLGRDLEPETFTKAVKGAYFTCSQEELAPGQTKNWYTIAEVNQSTAQVLNLKAALTKPQELIGHLEASIGEDTQALKTLVGLADGLQRGGEKLSTGRHFSNVLFNIMRGGVFDGQYQVLSSELGQYLLSCNKELYQQVSDWLENLPQRILYQDLLAEAQSLKNPHLYRLCREFLPLSFSRRHGDPSRPWNSFNIDVQDEKGQKKHAFEGNWRDIFQNWEALAFSFPAFIEGMIAKFVNASTLDGYNPYRITHEGIDWEIIEPDDPWSYIGYWGDHQVIYLQKLLEHARQHYPKLVQSMLTESNFVYACVPYRIRDYQSIKENPNDTIDFDHALNGILEEQYRSLGSDGKLVSHSGQLLRANLTEKLLVMALTKLYNFVPDGGIWLNTQRPEWNDANNALVGNGLSLVTLHYLRRFLVFAQELWQESPSKTVELQSPVAVLLRELKQILSEAPNQFNPKSREAFVDAMGKAGEKYRKAVYTAQDQDSTTVAFAEIAETLAQAQSLIEKTLANSKREDGLYHAYNLLKFDEEGAHVSYLYEMLEGQVAALSSQTLGAHQALELLDALKSSSMFREDQYSYMLYPNRTLAPFIQKNNLPEHTLKQSALIQKLLKSGKNKLVEADSRGGVHFSKNLHNAKDVKAVLQEMQSGPLALEAKADESLILEAFEAVFNHHAFTGRSGTFYGYEGLGSIYWHMVSKLLLAIQETIHQAVKQNAEPAVLGQLLAHFYETRAGIGINKDPKLYGAFPTDAYSHTPADAGAQQPGLTGQVKEDIITRWAVLGIQIHKGQIHFNPVIFSRSELLSETETFEFVNTDGVLTETLVKAGQMAFTYCGTLFVYNWSQEPQIEVTEKGQEAQATSGLTLSPEHSAAIFNRNGVVQKVELFYPFR